MFASELVEEVVIKEQTGKRPRTFIYVGESTKRKCFIGKKRPSGQERREWRLSTDPKHVDSKNQKLAAIPL